MVSHAKPRRVPYSPIPAIKCKSSRPAPSLAIFKLHRTHKVTHFPNTADSDLSVLAHCQPLATSKRKPSDSWHPASSPARIRASYTSRRPYLGRSGHIPTSAGLPVAHPGVTAARTDPSINQQTAR